MENVNLSDTEKREQKHIIFVPYFLICFILSFPFLIPLSFFLYYFHLFATVSFIFFQFSLIQLENFIYFLSVCLFTQNLCLWEKQKEMKSEAEREKMK